MIRDKSKIHGGEDAICEGCCRAWIHRKCAGLSKSAFERLKREEGKNVQEDVTNLLKERLQVQVDVNEIVEVMEIG